MDQQLKVERAEKTSYLRKYPNRRLYDVRESGYVCITDEPIRSRLLAGERVLMHGSKRVGEDVTAEVLAGLLVEEVRLGRISAVQLQKFLKETVGHVPTVRESRARSPAGLV